MSRSRLPRPLLAAALALIGALVVVACGSSAGAGWTYTPAGSATPAPSAAASGSGGTGSAEPGSADPSGSLSVDSPLPSQPSGTTVTIVATTPLRFDTPEVTGPAGQPFTILFDNQDPTAPHNVVVNDPAGNPVDIGDTAFFTGPEQRSYDAPALTAGAYPFLCQVHPQTMTGTLTIE